MTVGPGVVASLAVAHVPEERNPHAGRIQVAVVPPGKSLGGIESVAVQDGVGRFGDDGGSDGIELGVAEVGVVVAVPAVPLVARDVGGDDVGSQLGDGTGSTT